MLVIGDLFEMDHLAAFSLLLAIAIDLIVVIMAFAGSHIVDDTDYILDRVRQDMARRLGRIELDDAEQLDVALKENVEKYRKAMSYRLDMTRVSSEFRDAGKISSIRPRGEPEGGTTLARGLADRLKSRMVHWAGNNSPKAVEAVDDQDSVKEEAAAGH